MPGGLTSNEHGGPVKHKRIESAQTPPRDAERAVAVIAVAEHDEFQNPRVTPQRHAILDRIAERLDQRLLRRGEDVVEVDVDADEVVIALPAQDDRHRRHRLREVAHEISADPVVLEDGSSHRVDVGVGWVPLELQGDPRRRDRREARAAARDALRQRDLIAKPGTASDPRRVEPTTAGLVGQILVSLLLSLVAPFGLMVGLWQVGLDISGFVYFLVVGSLVVTAALIWNETLKAFTPDPLPDLPAGPPPPATAIIPAYLPNEASTIVETLRHFLEQDYPGELQVVLAYNTPEPHEVEGQLRALAEQDPRLRLLDVVGSTSKAQNVNAALHVATGEFVGVFDADHHPMQGAFTRAWRWLAAGYDVVQGHCVVRNGDQSLVARTVAVEFEQIYAVAHPGRTALHGFGIFGGSNGFWRTEALRLVRMRADRLTEDIDASLRGLLTGLRFATDPGLVSRELAPVTFKALWKQRVRWAQGWLEVSLDLLGPTLRSPRLSARQKWGAFALLGWREVVPWLSALPAPLIAFLYVRDGSITWSTAIFVLASLWTLSAGPFQALAAWRLAVPELRGRRRWFLAYALVGGVLYSELKNLLVRVAQIKHVVGERQWVVTPRQTAQEVDA